MRRAYITLANGQQVHYRRKGNGVPVLMLHPSPLSSAFLQPLANYLSTEFDVIALDTPGYGDSDPLARADGTLFPYVDVICEVLNILGLGKALVYGNATGAQLAIESAKSFPAKLAGIVLENAAVFSDAECDAMMGHYFPDLSPAADGAHLALAWKVARQTFQYFPWYDTSEQARVAEGEPSAEVVQTVALAYLRSGVDYALAYQAAFANERAEQLAAVTLPVQVVLWADSILLSYSRRLLQANMPANINFVEAASGLEARFSAVRKALQSLGGS